jgi:predicted permease
LASLQIALSLALFITAGLFARSLHNLTSVPLGFNPDHLTMFSVDPALSGSNAAAARLLFSNLSRSLQQIPGVESVAYGTGGPFPQAADVAVLIPDAKGSPTRHQSGVRSLIGPHYFATLGIPLIRGREFDERDRSGAPASIIVDQALARKLFGDRNPIGQTVTVFNGLDPNWQATLVGIVADHHVSWKRNHASLIYTPAQQAPHPEAINFYVRTSNDRVLAEPRIRELVRREAPMLSTFDLQTMQMRMAEFASGDRAMALLIWTFAALALVISLLGIYGVIAYNANSRTTEFGIRFALGARRFQVIKLMLQEAVFIVTLGVILALPVCWFGLSLARTQLYRVSLHDPLIFTSAILALTLCSFFAAVVPAIRSTRMDVQAALRHH